jgi:hypothetical protein
MPTMTRPRIFLLLFVASAVLATVGVRDLSAAPLTIGQTITNRGSLDGAVGAMFAAEVYGSAQGTVSEWSFQNSTGAYAGTRNITPVILEQTGNGGLGAVTIRGIGTPRTVSHTAATQTFDFGLTSGSASMGPRHYFGWIDSDGGTGTNGGVIGYSGGQDAFVLYFGSPGAVSVGDTRSVALNLDRRYNLQVTVDAPGGEAVGNGANQRGNVEGGTGGVFLIETPFTQFGRLDEWALWSWEGGRSITPLLFEEVSGNFILRGVGESRTVAGGQGTFTYDFNLQSGSDLLDGGYYFGWLDGSVNPATGSGTYNQGVPRYATGDLFSNRGIWLGNNGGSGSFLPGTAFGAGTVLPRAYSIQAFAVVPEPSTFALAALGLLSLAVFGRRRKR